MSGPQKFLTLISKPSKTRTALSWGIGLAMAAKWIYDSEQANPYFFSEAPTLIGTPKAREWAPEDMQSWNANIVSKDEQISWKAAPDQSRWTKQ
mmetsp:Transcript_98445/g.275689  ORF Transcript_98445/g.275689 Transcript_98445/m.275689 type:complete len:94 (-) Transcript_98445:303-584(-)